MSSSRLILNPTLLPHAGSSKLTPIPSLPPLDMLLGGKEVSYLLPKLRRNLFAQNILMVWSNPLFSYHYIFSSFLTDLPEVTISKNGCLQYKREQRLHVLLQTVSGHPESWLERGTPSARPRAGRTSTGRTCQRLHCHTVINTQQPKVLAGKEPLVE